MRAPAGRPAPGPRARRPPSPRGAPGPARPGAAQPPPPTQRATRCALGAPGQTVLLGWQSMARYGQTSLRPAEHHHLMPHAAARRACTAVLLTVGRMQTLPDQAWAVQPAAAHARQAARLLGELRALARQRRGEALLGCSLHLIKRLGARQQHLRALPRSAVRACMSKTSACVSAGALMALTAIQPVSRKGERAVSTVPCTSKQT